MTDGAGAAPSRAAAGAALVVALGLLGAGVFEFRALTTPPFVAGCAALALALAAGCAALVVAPDRPLRLAGALVARPRGLLAAALVALGLVALAPQLAVVALPALVPLGALLGRAALVSRGAPPAGSAASMRAATSLCVALAAALACVLVRLRAGADDLPDRVAWACAIVPALLALLVVVARRPSGAAVAGAAALLEGPGGLALAGALSLARLGLPAGVPAAALWPLACWALLWSLAPGGRLDPRRARALALAALALAVASRVAMVVALPRPVWQPDTVQYLGPVHDLLAGRGWDYPLHRTPGLALAVAAALAPARSYVAYLVLAHAVPVLAAAWAWRRVEALRGPGAGLLVLVGLALLPGLVWHEHVLMPEWLSTVCLAVAAVHLLAAFDGDGPRAAAAAWAGAWLALAVLTRPELIVVGLGVGVALLAGGGRRAWRATGALAAAAAVSLLAWCAHNALVHGRPVFTEHGNVGAFVPMSRHLDLDSPLHADVKAELRPVVEAHRALYPVPDHETPDAVQVEHLDRFPSLARLDPDARARVLQDLAREAEERAPWARTARTITLFAGWSLRMGEHALAIPRWDEERRSTCEELALPSRSLVRAMLDTPAARALEALPGRERAWSLARAPSLLARVLPFDALEATLGVALVLVLGLRRRRVAPVALATGAAAFVLLVCWVSNLELRRGLTIAPLVLVALADLAGRRARVTG